MPNRDPSSSTNTATPIGRVGTKPRAREHVDGGQRGDHTERAVERAAVRHGVEVAAGDDPRLAVPGVRAPPGHEVADGVGLDRRGPALAQASRNQASASQRRRRPAGSAVATGARVAADRRELGPQRRRRSHATLAHRDPDATLLGHLGRALVAGVDVPDDAHPGVDGEHALDLLRRPARCRPRP